MLPDQAQDCSARRRRRHAEPAGRQDGPSEPRAHLDRRGARPYLKRSSWRRICPGRRGLAIHLAVSPRRRGRTARPGPQCFLASFAAFALLARGSKDCNVFLMSSVVALLARGTKEWI